MVSQVIADVTARIVERSRPTRTAYLTRMEAMRRTGPRRGALGCANLAHGFAACGVHDKAELRADVVPNLGIVTAYNDMLSAHQPYERFPAIIKEAAREAGGVAQVAGGVPAMCDGVTQGRAGMEMSLFSRDVIALSASIALSHDMFDAAVFLGVCDKIVPGLVIAAQAYRPSAGGVRAGGADAVRHFQRSEIEGAPALRRGQSRRAPNFWKRRPPPIMRRAPAPSTAPPTPTRC